MIAKSAASGTGEDRRRGSWIPWIFVAGFGVVIAVNAIMIYVAATTWTGITTNRSYDKGLTYNRNLEAAARQEALGWQAAIEIEATEPRAGMLRLTLADRDGAAVNRARPVATFERPTQEGHDFSVELNPTGAGAYAASFAVPLEGIWDLRVVVRHGDELMVRSRRVFLR